METFAEINRPAVRRLILLIWGLTVIISMFLAIKLWTRGNPSKHHAQEIAELREGLIKEVPGDWARKTFFTRRQTIEAARRISWPDREVLAGTPEGRLGHIVERFRRLSAYKEMWGSPVPGPTEALLLEYRLARGQVALEEYLGYPWVLRDELFEVLEDGDLTVADFGVTGEWLDALLCWTDSD